MSEHEHTPKITVEELAALRERGADLVLVDTRPRDEFAGSAFRVAVSLRVRNSCTASTTRSIQTRRWSLSTVPPTRGLIGAQALRNAGLVNPVVALENGTAAWQIAGYEIAVGRDELLPVPSPEGLAWPRMRRVACATDSVPRSIGCSWSSWPEAYRQGLPRRRNAG